jgi:putative transposase
VRNQYPGWPILALFARACPELVEGVGSPNAEVLEFFYTPSFLNQQASAYSQAMPKRLKRYYGQDHLHYLTCSCYHRQPWLASADRRDLFLKILEETRQGYRFVVVGYVLMPDHIHLLLSEPEQGTPSTVMQVLKQRFARHVLADVRDKKRCSSLQSELWPAPQEHVWQRRFYDFNVWSAPKRIEKLVYMHRNPVRRKLVESPEQWRWSSFRSYAYGEEGPVKINQWPKKMKIRPAA